jgi:hypothetical protein
MALGEYTPAWGEKGVSFRKIIASRIQRIVLIHSFFSI